MTRLTALLVAITLALSANVTLSPPTAPAMAAHLITAPTSGDIIPNQYIVLLKNGVNPASEAHTAEVSQGVRLRHMYEHALHGFSFDGSAQAAAALANNPNVTVVVPDRRVHTQDIPPATKAAGVARTLARLRGKGRSRVAMAATATGQMIPTGISRVGDTQNTTAAIDGIDTRVNVNVAVIDTGIDLTHPDLNVVGGVDCTGSGTYADGYGHGTHVAGTIGAIDNGSGVVGMAPGVRLWAVRVLDSTGSGTWSDVACGVDWVTGTRTDSDTTNDIAVANMSLGGSGSNDGNCGYTNNDILHQAICASVADGVVYAVAAGNSNADAGTFVPAAYPEVLTVSAVADSDGQPGGLGAATSYGADDTLATFSNYGTAVDVAAPGVNITSTYLNDSYATMSGTSMATPHVTGAVALYVANHGMATSASGVAAIRQAITSPTNNYVVPQSDLKGYVDNAADNQLNYHAPMLYDAYAGGVAPPPPTGTYDVAVSNLSAPPWIGQATSGTITATASNLGSTSETFLVALTDTTGNTTIGSQTVTLAAGASTSLSFTWSPSTYTTAGNHTITLTAATVLGETNTSNNARTATVDITQGIHDIAVSGIGAPGSVQQGGSASVSVTFANQGNQDDTFGFTLTDTTAGTTIATDTVSLPAGMSTTATYTWSTSSATAVGNHTLTAIAAAVAGETNTTNNSASTTVSVTTGSQTPAPTTTQTPTPVPTGAPSDFQLSASPSTLTVSPGKSGNDTVTLTGLGGYTSSVKLSVGGLPAGATASFSANPVTPTSAGKSVTLQVKNNNSTPGGTYTLTITGTGSDAAATTHSAQVTLVVPSFSLTAGTASITVPRGTSGTDVVTVTGLGGYSAAVSLQVSGLPGGTSSSLSPAQVMSTAAGTSSTLTINVAASASTGTRTITITGSGSGVPQQKLTISLVTT